MEQRTVWVSLYSPVDTEWEGGLEEAELQIEVLTTEEEVERLKTSYDPDNEYLRIEQKTIYF